jgi:OTU domain-containing protein 6
MSAPAPLSSLPAGPRETRHAMKLRHKSELKSLLAQPAKAIGAKKKQKEDAQEMEKLHAEQLKDLERKEKEETEREENGGGEDGAQSESAGEDGAAPAASSAASSSTAAAASASSSSGRQPSRAQHKKARAAEKAAARTSELRELTKDMIDARAIEDGKIRERMEQERQKTKDEGKLRVREMVSDGHCLYRAVADQVQRHHLSRDLPLDDNAHPFMAMRQLAAAYIDKHRSEFEPFMLVEDANGKPVELTEETWRKYLKDLVDEELAVWGGHQEAVALSKALQRCIVIWSADGRMEVGEEFQSTAAAADAAARAASPVKNDPTASPLSPSPDPLPLQISFHQHYYGLGAHYNSVVIDEEADEQEAFEKGENEQQ